MIYDDLSISSEQNLGNHNPGGVNSYFKRKKEK
jgi:hypothetical protein